MNGTGTGTSTGMANGNALLVFQFTEHWSIYLWYLQYEHQHEKNESMKTLIRYLIWMNIKTLDFIELQNVMIL